MEDYRKFTAMDFLISKSMSTTIFTSILVAVTVLACTNSKNTDGTQIERSFKDSLMETQIGASSYYISLPKNYAIKETKGGGNTCARSGIEGEVEYCLEYSVLAQNLEASLHVNKR
jgi:hypothetical protein